jgi:branched-subunit amino acid aminotransferase/4-amino-4-deoxychorismate lyase
MAKATENGTSAGKMVPEFEREEALQLLVRTSCEYYAFYSSVLGGIVTDPGLFVVPIDDHQFVRGHGVFDTCTLKNGRLYGLDAHLERFEKSMDLARIRLAPELRASLRSIIFQTAAAARQPDGVVRYFASAGPGNFSIKPTGCTGALYVVVYPDKYDPDNPGISEITVASSEVPVKLPPHCTMKSNNYLPNALMSMAAEDRGGSFGIWLDDAGYVLEGSVVGVVARFGNEVVTPPCERILRSITVAKILEETASDGRWQPDVRELTKNDLLKADELLLCGGDVHITPIASLDGNRIGNGSTEFIDFVQDRIGLCVDDDQQTYDLSPYRRSPPTSRRRCDDWPLLRSLVILIFAVLFPQLLHLDRADFMWGYTAATRTCYSCYTYLNEQLLNDLDHMTWFLDGLVK